MKFKHNRGVAYCAALFVAIPLLAGCGMPVSGEAVAGGSGPIVDVTGSKDTTLRKDFDASPEDVNKYWTDDKFGGAEAPDLKPGDDALTNDQATGIVVHPSTGPVAKVDVNAMVETSAGDPYPAPGLTAKTQGRLYVKTPDGTGLCSASVINSPSMDLIVTAAHCVWDTFEQELNENVLFIPADASDGQVQPYGQWAGTSAYVPEEFTKEAHSDESGMTTGEGWAYDFAFIRLAPNDGKKIQEVTGGQGLAFGSTVEGLTAIGYPTREPFDGTSQRYCASRTFDEGSPGYVIPCQMTQGCSGGGWLTRLDPVTGAGYVTSVSSRGTPEWIQGTVLGQKALDLYNKASSEGT